MEGYIVKASRVNNKFNAKQKTVSSKRSNRSKTAYKRPSTRRQAIRY